MALSNVRAAMRAAKNAVMQFSDIEVKVREATSNDPWGPTSTLMAEIARATNDYQQYPQLFHRLWQRLNDVEHVMHVQKALILVDYLLRNGAERFINDAKRRARDIAQLKRFKHYDANNNDDAKEARNKAKLVYDLLMNDKQLAEERQKAKKISDVKSQGFGSSADHFTSDPYGRRYDDNSDDRYGSGGSSYYSNGNSGDVPEKRAASSGAGRASGAPSNDEPFETHDVDDWTKETGEERKRRDSGASAEKGDEAEKKKKKKKKVVKDKAAANTVEEAVAKKEEEEAAPEPEEQDAEDADKSEKKKKKKGEKKKKKKEKESENGDIRRPSGDFGSDPFAAKPSSSSSSAAVSSDPFSGNSNGNGSNRSAAAAYNEFLTRQSSGGAPSGSSDDFLSKLAAQGGLVSPASGFKSPDSNHLYEHDFLTGGSGGATITDMFANASISNNRSPSASPTLSFQQSSTPEQSRPLVFDEMAAQQQQAAAAQNADLWHAAADLTNLDNITEQERRARKKEVTNDNAMSMAMMRSIQPLGAEKHSVVVPPPVASSAPFAGGASSTALVVTSPQPYAAGYPPPPYGYGASAPGYAMPPLGAPMPVYPSGYGYGYPGGQPGYGSPFPAPPPQTPIRTAPHYGGGAPSSINQQTKTNIPIFDVPKAQPSLQNNNNNNAFNGLTWK